MSDSERHAAEPLVFGEVLFDHFSDGSRVLGGAPFNVAWHLCGFGSHPLFVSAVGADETGREVLDRMEEWGMRTGGVQVDPAHPTGEVTARIVDGEPAYEIGTDQAYDHVSKDAAVRSAGDTAVSLIYHGTLALRLDESREALADLQGATGAPTYIDLNLRRPWWTHEGIRSCLRAARWLKLNRSELETVTGGPAASFDASRDRALALAEETELEAVIVTMGAEGSLMVRGGRAWTSESEPLEPDEVVDTVGAGDAFSAVACIGLVEGWEPADILGRGDAFARELCRIRGATTADRALYARHRERWSAA